MTVAKLNGQVPQCAGLALPTCTVVDRSCRDASFFGEV